MKTSHKPSKSSNTKTAWTSALRGYHSDHFALFGGGKVTVPLHLVRVCLLTLKCSSKDISILKHKLH